MFVTTNKHQRLKPLITELASVLANYLASRTEYLSTAWCRCGWNNNRDNSSSCKTSVCYDTKQV